MRQALAAARPTFNLKTHQRNPPVLTDSARKVIDSLVTMAGIHNPYFDEGLAMPVLGLRDVTVPHSWYLEFAEQHYDSAFHELAGLIRKHPDALPLYIYRAKAAFYLKQYDTAAAIFAAAVGRVDARDTTRLLPGYLSREMLTYATGLAYEEAHRDAAATASYQRTVIENLGFYMAHLHLASAALAVHDTATALTEARVAGEIRPTDPVVQLFLGYALLNAQHPADAIEHLRAAIATDPYFALPYYYMGQSYELTHDTAASLVAYRAFLAHASRSDNLRQSAEEALRVLGGTAK